MSPAIICALFPIDSPEFLHVPNLVKCSLAHEIIVNLKALIEVEVSECRIKVRLLELFLIHLTLSSQSAIIFV